MMLLFLAFVGMANLAHSHHLNQSISKGDWYFRRQIEDSQRNCVRFNFTELSNTTFNYVYTYKEPAGGADKVANGPGTAERAEKAHFHTLKGTGDITFTMVPEDISTSEHILRFTLDGIPPKTACASRDRVLTPEDEQDLEKLCSQDKYQTINQDSTLCGYLGS